MHKRLRTTNTILRLILGLLIFLTACTATAPPGEPAVSATTSAAITPDLSPDSPYMRLLALYEQAGEALVKPGWVFIQENWLHDIDSESYSMIDERTALPRIYQRGNWYQLDESGNVIQSISLLQNQAGGLLETVIFSDGQVLSSNPGSQPDPLQPYPLNIAASYIGSLEANLKRGLGRVEEVDFEDRPAVQFTLDEDIQVADPEWYEQPILSDQVSAVFDRENGQLLQVMTVVNLADGSQRTLELLKLTVMNEVEPPAWLLEGLSTEP